MTTSIKDMAKDQHQRIATMTLAAVYPHYLAKIERKGRTREELHRVLSWLTGYDEQQLAMHLEQGSSFEQFFGQATLHPNAHLIKGTICGYRIEDIDAPLTRQVRYLDKLVDELAKGRALDRILRTAPQPRDPEEGGAIGLDKC